MHLVVGVDGSTGSLTTLDRTIERVAETGDDLTVALLVDAESVTDADAVADDVRDRLQTAHVDASIRRVGGDPASELVELADGEGFDRLVIPGGERSPLGKINIDPFAEFVLLNATTSLTLIR